MDPHTAVALHVYEQNKKDDIKSIILSTASPYKFPHSVAKGIAPTQADADEWSLFDVVHDTAGLRIPQALCGLKERPVRFDLVCEADQMMTAVNDFLKIK